MNTKFFSLYNYRRMRILSKWAGSYNNKPMPETIDIAERLMNRFKAAFPNGKPNQSRRFTYPRHTPNLTNI